jgi:hypothetical protein
MDFKQKYLKYKEKYISLKNQIGGNPVIDLIRQAIAILVTIPDVGTSNTLRKLIYDIIQAQHIDDDSPIYDELKCSIHLGLIGEEGGSIVTLLCGHSFCRQCINSWLQRPYPPNCPSCRSPIGLPAGSFGNTAELFNITRRLLPLGAPGASASASSSASAPPPPPQVGRPAWNCTCGQRYPGFQSICLCGNTRDAVYAATSASSTTPELTAILQRLEQALALLRQVLDLIRSEAAAVAAAAASGAARAAGPRLDQNPAFKAALYDLIKCQRSDTTDCAIFKELRCQLPVDPTTGSVQHLCGANGDAVTLLCGHSFCRECIRPFHGRRCPCITTNPGAAPTQCNTVLNVPLASIARTAAIHSLVGSLSGPLSVPAATTGAAAATTGAAAATTGAAAATTGAVQAHVHHFEPTGLHSYRCACGEVFNDH